jgi:alkyldihydroxyacetonephosphate synthase
VNGVHVDRTSLVAEVDAALTLAEVEDVLATSGLTLGLGAAAPRDATVADWLAEGARGARDPFRDPADHLVAGLDARLHDGRDLRVRPSPRRAVGPDLVALFVGTRGRFGTVTRAHLRVHLVDVPRADAPPFAPPDAGEPSAGEHALLDAIARELGVSPRPSGTDAR